MAAAAPSVSTTTPIIGEDNYKLGELIVEGKTKKVWTLDGSPNLVYIESKDRITAGDGARAHDLEGKAAVSNRTNCKVFELLNAVGLKTSYVKKAGDKAFIARRCAMIPIEWVTRRIATGSYLRRHPGVTEGFQFKPPMVETFYKDDEHHDPLWSESQIVSARFALNGILIGEDEIDVMRKTTVAVFEILEKVWSEKDCVLVDMKIEFGVDIRGEIIISDVIDSDSWRLWPSGDKRLMKDKQVYRELSEVTEEALETVKRNFIWIADQLDTVIPETKSLCVILMGSPADEHHSAIIRENLNGLGIPCVMRVTSAHKNTEEALKIAAYYEGSGKNVVFIAVAGRSNGLGPVISGNTNYPVINCPPVRSDNVAQDIWSSLNVPSGIGCTTIVYPEGAALAAAQIHGLTDCIVWARLRVRKLQNYINLKAADKKMRNLHIVGE